MSNENPQLFFHRVRCARMLPESNPELRAAGASDHECQDAPEYHLEVHVAGLSVRIYICARHRREILNSFAERRLEQRLANSRAAGKRLEEGRA